MSYAPENLSFELPLSDAVDAVEEAGHAAIEREVVEFFEQFRNNIVRYLGCLGLSVADGEEISQEVFMLLFQHLRQRKSRRNLRGWIFRVAHNLGLKRRLNLQVQNKSSVAGSRAFDLCAAPEPSPEEHVLFRQRQRHLLAVVNALPFQDRQCLYLRSEGLNYREIAGILEISLGNVAKSLCRTWQRLANAEQ